MGPWASKHLHSLLQKEPLAGTELLPSEGDCKGQGKGVADTGPCSAPTWSSFLLDHTTLQFASCLGMGRAISRQQPAYPPISLCVCHTLGQPSRAAVGIRARVRAAVEQALSLSTLWFSQWEMEITEARSRRPSAKEVYDKVLEQCLTLMGARSLQLWL